MRFDPTITLGNALTVLATVVLILLAWRDLDWRVRNIESWKGKHERTTEQRETSIALLREAVIKIESLANGQDRRLEMLEMNFQGRDRTN